MDRKPSDVIYELDALVAEFSDRLRVGIGELHQSLITSYVFEDYLNPSEEVRKAEAVQQQLRRLFTQVREYVDERNSGR